jgi:ATP-dependent DNA ligase
MACSSAIATSVDYSRKLWATALTGQRGEGRDDRRIVIDGEVVTTDKQGLATFNLLRHGTRVKPEAFFIRLRLARAR